MIPTPSETLKDICQLLADQAPTKAQRILVCHELEHLAVKVEQLEDVANKAKALMDSAGPNRICDEEVLLDLAVSNYFNLA
jgi:hypothetical protein